MDRRGDPTERRNRPTVSFTAYSVPRGGGGAGGHDDDVGDYLNSSVFGRLLRVHHQSRCRFPQWSFVVIVSRSVSD